MSRVVRKNQPKGGIATHPRVRRQERRRAMTTGRGRPRQAPANRAVRQRLTQVGGALAVAVSVAACSAGVSRFDFPAFSLRDDNGSVPSTGTAYNGGSDAGAPRQLYNFRPNDHRYGNGGSGRLSSRPANETTVQKYAGRGGHSPAARDGEFDVSAIPRQPVERQPLAPPQDSAPRRQQQYESQPTAARAPWPSPAARAAAPAAPVQAVAPVAAEAPSRAPRTPRAHMPGHGNSVVVRQGDTLFSLSQRYQVSVAALREANGLTDNNIRIGQQLVIPGATTTPQAQTGAGHVQPMSPARSSAPRPQPGARPDKLAAPQTSQAPARPSKTAKQAEPVSKKPVRIARTDPRGDATPQNNFRWPVQGRILSRFGAKADGSHNDGVNLAVPRGTEVKAAEAGVVAYAGSELKAYGKLILIRHANNWVSAYAHNDEILVKRGDKVRRGQVISRAGTTGSVTQPQLHFELRKGSSPVDPMKYISGP